MQPRDPQVKVRVQPEGWPLALFVKHAAEDFDPSREFDGLDDVALWLEFFTHTAQILRRSRLFAIERLH
jgi:hypothetical protein